MSILKNSDEKATILIADDIEINRLILENILKTDYNIEHASDGRETLDKLLHGSRLTSLVLLDITLPDIEHGFEVLKNIKEHAVTRNIPVIVITPLEGLEARALKCGAIDYILKPFNPEILKLRVDNNIELSCYREKLEKSLLENSQDEFLNSREAIALHMLKMIEGSQLDLSAEIRETISKTINANLKLKI